MILDLREKNALVCGASKGIGKAIALELASIGANVTLVARSKSVLKQLVSELDSSQGQQHDFIALDFNKPEETKSSLENNSHKGRYNIVINNSGGPSGGMLEHEDSSKLLAAFKHHVITSQTIAQICIPFMKSSGYGRIISITSTSVRQPIDGLAVSNITRAAMASWTKTLSNELAPFGITVNNVLPGTTETGRIYELLSTWAKQWGKSESEVMDQLKAQIPFQRFARPEEIAAVVAFLASPAASYLTGVNLPVDGGKIKSI